MAANPAAAQLAKGGEFLFRTIAPQDVFTHEDLSEEHVAIAKTADEFWTGEVVPKLSEIRHGNWQTSISLLRKSAALGLTAVCIPEQFGGLELDFISSAIVDESVGRDGSYAATHGSHTGIGTLPLLYFGTDEQKARYLPKLASAETVAAYALTEPHAGSDAQAMRTRADLSADGSHYILNGQKMWITNGGAADLFTVFAKVGGERVTAFLVERSFGGVSSGTEEKKMGIKGSSTTAVYFENVPVPLGNVLGEIGRGHIIAFNILNVGRLKLGTVCAAAAKEVLATSIRYAKERKAFGSSIAQFGAIQSKIAEMAIRIYAAESMAWRLIGQIQQQLDGGAGDMLATMAEYAAECSIVKVFGSEALDYVVDEGVQIHGGFGFHQDYAVECAYRDSRINRIFEGTNEINRLLIPTMLLKRYGAPGADESESMNTDEEMRLVENAKTIARLALKTGDVKNQDVAMSIADIIIQVFAMESTLLRTRKLEAKGKQGIATEMTRVFLRDAMARVEISARNVCGAGHINTYVLSRLAAYEPIDASVLRGNAARSLIARERYFI